MPDDDVLEEWPTYDDGMNDIDDIIDYVPIEEEFKIERSFDNDAMGGTTA